MALKQILLKAQTLAIGIQTHPGPHRQGQVRVAMTTAPSPQHRHLQRLEELTHQGRQRLQRDPGKIPDQHATNAFKLARQTQLGQQAIDPVQRLVNVFNKQDTAATLYFCGCPQGRAQQ
ncbi:hypothetical protein D3C79_976600 [compost metagenome]